MYMLKQHTLDLKTDKGLFNSGQIILYFHVRKLPYDPGLGSQRWLNLRAELKTSCTTIELQAAVLFQNVSDCNNGPETICFEKLPTFQLFKRSNPTPKAYL